MPFDLDQVDMPDMPDFKYLIKKKEIICSKYAIDDDNYFYDFIPSTVVTVDEFKDYCLSIGSCTFYPVIQEGGFPYSKYIKYLVKHVLDPTTVGIVFAPSIKGIDCHDDKLNCIESIWRHDFTSESETLDPLLAYKTIFTHNLVILPSILKARYEQAAQINNMASGRYCALTFAQMQELSGLSMKMKDDKRPYITEKFLGYVSLIEKECFFSCDGCDRKITIIIDCLHQIVIMKVTGKHVEECYERNKNVGYRAFQNIAIDNYKRYNKTYKSIQEKYYQNMGIIDDIGPFPDNKIVHSWAHRRNVKSEHIFKGINWGDYNVSLHEFEKALAVDQVVGKLNGRFRLVDMRKDNVISSFSYSESLDFERALIFSSKKCLEALANASWWSSDITLSTLQDCNVKLITVSIEREMIGKKSSVILCAVATLPGRGNTANYTQFFKKLLELIKENHKGPLKVDTVIIDESKAGVISTSRAFSNKVRITHCVKNKIMNMEKNFDMFTTFGVIDAMYAFSRANFLRIFASVVVRCDKRLDELKQKLCMGFFETCHIKMIKRSTNMKGRKVVYTKETIEEAIKFYQNCIYQLNILFISRAEWALYFRISKLKLTKKRKMVIKLNSQEEFDEMNEKYSLFAMKSNKLLFILKTVFEKHGIKVTNTLLNAVDDDNDNVIYNGNEGNLPSICQEISISHDNTDQKNLIEIAKEFQSFARTIEPSEISHNDLKINKIKNENNLINLFDKLEIFFNKQERLLTEKLQSLNPNPIIKDMRYYSKLDYIGKSCFVLEFNNFFECINKKEGVDLAKVFSRSKFAIEKLKPCVECIIPRVLNIPCSHVMFDFYKSNEILSNETINQKNKKVKMMRKIIHVMDRKLMKYRFPEEENEDVIEINDDEYDLEINDQSNEDIQDDKNSDDELNYEKDEDEEEVIPGNTYQLKHQEKCDDLESCIKYLFDKQLDSTEMREMFGEIEEVVNKYKYKHKHIHT